MIIKKHLISFCIFLCSLGFLAIVFFLHRAFESEIDEYDHLTMGYLMSRGKMLYTDIFSHHFPFPYFWTYFFTPFWSIENPSRTLTVFRMSLYVFYAVSFLLTYLSFKKNITRLALSGWIILLSLFLILYRGNIVLSEVFFAVSVSVVSWVAIPIIFSSEKFTKYKSYLLLLFCSIAFWTQPLSILLFLIPLILISSVKERIKFIFKALVLNSIPIIGLLLTNQFESFIEQAIWFNFAIYVKEFPEQATTIKRLLQLIELFIQNEITLLTNISSFIGIFQFILHTSFLILLFKTIREKEYKNVLLLFVLFVVTRVRELKITAGSEFNYGIYPLLLMTSIITIYFCTNIWRKSALAGSGVICLLFITAFIPAYDIYKQSLDHNYYYHYYWSEKQEIGNEIKNIVHTDETILVYPHAVDIYTFADRLPTDRFLYWYPWIHVVEEYRVERQNTFEMKKPAIIYLGGLNLSKTEEFYVKAFPGLTKGYIQIKKENKPTGIWLREDLQERLTQ